jgi:alkylation response protein AidB-like acyl-CoA dehydrogenase
MTELISRRDIDFLLYEWLHVEGLTTRERFAEHSRDTFDAVLDLAADMAERLFAPHNRASDENEPHVGTDGRVVLVDGVKIALQEFAKAGFIAGTFDESVGGLQLPTTVSRAAMTWFQAANAATTSYPFLTIANANLLVAHGTAEQLDTWVTPMLEGRYLGTMCLSEPEAGSSLADLTTRATPAGDGTYRVTGTKMWISAGEHELSENIVHLVLAKAPGGGSGTKGISLFIVPKFLPDGTRNDVTLVGLNHKMGNRGTTNTLLNFGDGTHRTADEPGAVGYLVGELHRGLGYMFHMMNEARIGVGMLATALGYAGYLASVEYATTRRQGRPVGMKDPSVAPVRLIDHPDVKRMLLAQKSYVEGALALGLYCADLVDRAATSAGADSADAQLLLDVLTPIAKSWPSQWCLEANSLAIQVHGGYGYARDFGVEQLYRDNRLNPIHEGTHGIQGLDLLGRKVIADGGRGLRLLAQTIEASLQRAQDLGDAAVEYVDAVRHALARLTTTTARLWAAEDVTTTLANSTLYLEATGHVVLGWIWLEQLIAAAPYAGDFYDGKRAAAQYFFRYELPRTGPQFDLLDRLDRTTVDISANVF